MPSEPNLPAGLALSLAAALLSALGMNLQAAQALIEQAAVAEKGAWRTKLGRAWSSDRLTTQENDRLETDRVDGDGDRVTVDSPASPTSITSNERTALIRSSSSRWPIPSPIEEAEFLASPAPLPHGTRLFKRLLGRTMWHAGLAIYLIGAAGLSTYALEFIPPVLAAPLSSASLVFNLGLARWMLGTRITLLDGLGTFLLLLGSTLCSVFSHPDPPLSPDSISRLFTSPAFLGLFLGQLVPALILFFSLVTAESMQPHGILHRHLWVPWLAPKIEQSGAVSWLETEDGWLLPGIEAASEKNGTQTRRIGMG